MKKIKILLLSFILITQGCIGDDFIDDKVQPEIRITSNILSLTLDTAYQFEYMYLNNVGKEEQVDAVWQSDDLTIIDIEPSGIAIAKQKGITNISVSYNNNGITLVDSMVIEVSEKTIENSDVKMGSIVTTSSYKLAGDFNITSTNEALLITFDDNYTASTSLPGLYLYLSNNKNSIANALEVGKVTVFDGAHTYSIDDIDINQYSYLVYYCKPFNVKVGDGQIN